MFFGKPVVAFRIGGIPEVAGDPACLAKFGDIPAMASALDNLVSDPKAARQIGERGRKRAEELFTAGRIVPQYEALYRRVLGR
jgi:glycosyltransferase involved in cell wall biosynthesis